MLYHYLFRSARPIEISVLARFFRSFDMKTSKVIQFKRMPLLAVVCSCKQIHDETFPIYFRTNSFTFGKVGDMSDFLQGIGEERRNLISEISFEYDGNKRNDSFKWLAKYVS